MFEDRSLKIDLCAIALLALVVFIGVALWTFNANDPPSTNVWPAINVVHNACGQAGAITAHYLFESLGVAAYYLVVSLAVLTLFLFRRREIDQPILRTFGWVVSIIGLTTLIALALPNATPGPVVGAGGYIGAMGRTFLESHFAVTGSYIFALSVLLAGLLLSTDYFVFRAAATTTSITGRSLLQIGHFGHVAKKAVRPKLDLEQEEELEDDEECDEEHECDDEELEEDETEVEDEHEAEGRDIKVRTPNDSSSAERVESNGTASKIESDGPSTASKLAKGLKAALGITNREQERQAPAAAAPPKTERQAVIEQLEAAEQQSVEETDYELPPLELLLPNEHVCYEEHEKEVRRKAKVLEKTFKDFGFNVRVVEIETGPVIAQFEVELEAGLRLSKITGLADDLAIALRVPSVRIVAPIPGKNTVGIEVPNENRQLVRLREVVEETNGRAKRMKIPLYLGKDVAGNPMVVDLTTLPHLLIAGRTGTGKSVCLNSIIVSMLMTRGPDEVRMLMVDPKMVELSGYRKLPHLMHPVVTDMRKAEAILAWAVDKMEERYQLLSRAGVRHLSVYNQLGDDELHDRIRPENDDEWRQIPRHLPYIVIVADELADLMMTAGKDVEQHIIRLAQKSRAVGIHLILATQKPTVDVITGLIKSNLPARIAFQVASRTDSRVVLDEMGAEKLLGNGDMLFLLPGTSTMLRGQGTFLSDDEITRVVDFVGVEAPQFAGELMQLKTKDEIEAAGSGNFQSRDDLYEAAVEIVIRERRGSCSLLQRALGIGYGRAARLIDFMAEDGVVGQYNGSQARDVLISLEDWESRHQDALESSPPSGTVLAIDTSGSKRRSVATSSTAPNAATIEPRRRNKIVPRLEEPSDLEDEAEDDTGNEDEYDHEEWDDDRAESDEEADSDEELADDEEWEDEEESDAGVDSKEAEEDDAALEKDDEDVEYEEEEWDEDEAGEVRKPQRITTPRKRRTRVSR
ncbi:MAG TPA: DNA translocase FtsK 4TM domain-containing protein [Lacipirellulaceae bacterium]|nr:DNA translocase FtsK 4TM domain-containing protein [Lacipirellulaceae bacterium]